MDARPIYRWLRSAVLLVAVMLAGLQASAHTQFNASCINLKQGLDNTAFYLRLEPSLFHIDPKSGQLSSDMQITVSFRIRGIGRIIMTRNKELHDKHDFLSGDDPFFFAFTTSLPAGDYEVWVEIEDRRTRRRHIEGIPYQCRDLNAPVAVSDPLLIQEFGGVLAPQPLLGDHFTSVPEQLSMTAFVYAQQPGFYRAKAVLYLRQNDIQTGPTDMEMNEASQYLTMNQMNTVVDASKGMAVLNHQLDLKDLPHGEYLVELYLFKDDSLVAETARTFFIDWKQLRDVFSDLNAAIEMMAYVATPEQIQMLKSIKDADEQQKAFLDFWASRANPSQEGPVDAIERYFSRIFYANENFNEVIPGWQTDRGKTLTLYGPPDHQTSMTFNGRLYEAWTYPKWGLKLVFRNDNGRMRRMAIG